MPILGVVASAKSGNLFASNFESIATVLVGAGGTSTVTFNSIPATYNHLQIRVVGFSSSADNPYSMRFNNDTGANYSRHGLENNSGGTAVADTTSMRVGGYTGDTISGGVFICDVLDYSLTNKYKTIRSLCGNAGSPSGGYITYQAGNWRSNAAVSRIDIFGVTFTQHSLFALYGIKGA